MHGPLNVKFECKTFGYHKLDKNGLFFKYNNYIKTVNP